MRRGAVRAPRSRIEAIVEGPPSYLFKDGVWLIRKGDLDATMLFGRREGRFTPDRRRYIAALLREWIALELLGHVGLIVLRQICGTLWSWSTGGPFAYLDVSRAMLH